MADTSQSRRRAFDCPLYKLIKETWIDYDSGISSFSISEEDVLCFTLWCVEGLKDNTGDRKRHGEKQRALLFKQIRNRYGPNGQPEELNLLADIIMAYTLECLEWAQTADWTTFMSVYDEAYNSISPNKDSILGYKKAFNAKVFEMALCSSFKEWIVDHLTNDVFLTEEDAKWTSPQKDSSKKTDTKQDKSKEDHTPYVLKYVCSDETTRTNRFQRAMILMQNWNWIEEPSTADDFYDFFAGEARYCNLKWKTGPGGSSSTVLTFLIKTLLEQDYFEKQRKASVNSIVKNQFGLTANYNFDERLTSDDKNRIALLLVVLDPDITFKTIPSKGPGDGLDYSDEVMNAIYKGELHKIKDLNKWLD